MLTILWDSYIIIVRKFLLARTDHNGYDSELTVKLVLIPNSIREEFTMKRKAISIILATSILTTSAMTAFAAEGPKTIKPSDTFPMSSGYATILDSNGGITGNTGSEITLFGNERYKYRTEYRYGSWVTKNITITASQAKSEATYESAILHAVSTIPLLGPFTNWLISNFYTNPTAAAGKYTIKHRSVKKMQVNILTGSAALLESGYQFQVTHNGKTISYTLWE